MRLKLARYYHCVFTTVFLFCTLFTLCRCNSSEFSSKDTSEKFPTVRHLQINNNNRTSLLRPLFYWGEFSNTTLQNQKLTERPNRNRKNRNKKLENSRRRNKKRKDKQKRNKNEKFILQEKNFKNPNNLYYKNQTDFDQIRIKKYRRKPFRKYRRFRKSKVNKRLRTPAQNLYENQNLDPNRDLIDNNVISKKCDCTQICDNMTCKCECYTGYLLQKDGKTCKDIDECQDPKVCPYLCMNTIGSYVCLPKEPEPENLHFTLPVPKKTPIKNITSSYMSSNLNGLDFGYFEGVNCPPLFPPRHGRVECSTRKDSWRSSRPTNDKPRRNQVGSICELACPLGYKRDGKWKKVCGMEGRWKGEDSGRCVHVLPRNFNPQNNYIDIKWEYSEPTIQCPDPIVTHLEPGFETILVQIPPPLASVEQRHISSDPKLHNRFLELPKGQHWIRFKATHPISGQSTECSTYVAVKI